METISVKIRPGLDQLLENAKQVDDLYEHQVSVYNLLLKWDTPVWVREAGLLSFIYGNQFCDSPNIKVSKEIVVKEVGELCEGLIRLFADLNLRQLQSSVNYMNRITGKVCVDLYDKEHKNIREALDLIELADLLANGNLVPFPLAKRISFNTLANMKNVPFAWTTHEPTEVDF